MVEGASRGRGDGISLLLLDNLLHHVAFVGAEGVRVDAEWACEAARHGYGRWTFLVRLLSLVWCVCCTQECVSFGCQSAGEEVGTELEDVSGVGLKYLLVEMLYLLLVSFWESHDEG